MTSCTHRNSDGRGSRCSTYLGRITAAENELSRLARRASRSPESAAKLADEIARARKSLAISRELLVEHAAECDAAAERLARAA